MAFENARLTSEEAAIMTARAIPNPGNPFITLKPYTWTIDREADVYLIMALQERESTELYHFVFGWKGAVIPVKLKENWAQGSPRIWELLSLPLTEKQQGERPAIVQSLKDALTVFGMDGNPNEPFNTINKSVQVQFKEGA